MVVAYLIYTHRMTAAAAIAQVQEARPIANPNDSFREQLEIYERIMLSKTAEKSPFVRNEDLEYRRWLLKKQAAQSSSMYPDISHEILSPTF